MSSQRQTIIKEKIKDCMRDKFRSYKRETDNMPFHYRLLGKDRMALFSFIHSVNTTFGVSIYEPVALAIARDRFKVAETQVAPFNQISTEAHHWIQIIIDRLRNTNNGSNKPLEIQEIREVCQIGNLNEVNLTQVDIWLENYEDELFLIDLKTAKPNKGDFQKFNALFWSGLPLSWHESQRRL